MLAIHSMPRPDITEEREHIQNRHVVLQIEANAARKVVWSEYLQSLLYDGHRGSSESLGGALDSPVSACKDS